MSENQVIATETQATEQAAPEVKLSRREKLLAKYNTLFAKRSDIDAELGELVAEINSIDKLASVDAGSVVYITVGKGEDAKEVEALVVAVKVEADGSKQYKVTYGTGFDTDVTVVTGKRLRLEPTQAEAPAEQVEEAPAA